MQRERSSVQCQLHEATAALKEVGDAKISDLEVARQLGNMPVYRELSIAIALRELEKHRAGAAASGTKLSADGSRRELSDEQLVAAQDA